MWKEVRPHRLQVVCVFWICFFSQSIFSSSVLGTARMFSTAFDVMKFFVSADHMDSRVWDS